MSLLNTHTEILLYIKANRTITVPPEIEYMYPKNVENTGINIETSDCTESATSKYPGTPNNIEINGNNSHNESPGYIYSIKLQKLINDCPAYEIIPPSVPSVLSPKREVVTAIKYVSMIASTEIINIDTPNFFFREKYG